MAPAKNNTTGINFMATNVLLVLLSLLVIVHLLILIRIIPFEFIWGRRLTNASQMVRFESLSVFINLLMVAVVAIDAGMLRVKIPPAVIKGALWAMFILFLINTIGNYTSLNPFERMIFTPLTLVLSLLCLLLAINKKSIKRQ